jgi:uncharacterized membrane protein
MKKSFLLLSLAYASCLHAHDGNMSGDASLWIHWIGGFHPVILHFPIALIVMTCIAELFVGRSQYLLFDHACRFMIFAAALWAIPTVLCGLAYAYDQDYSGVYLSFFWWHRLFGFITAFLAIAATYARETYGRHALYGSLLVLSFISVLVTGFLGGSLTFGIGALVPPIFFNQ